MAIHLGKPRNYRLNKTGGILERIRDQQSWNRPRPVNRLEAPLSLEQQGAVLHDRRSILLKDSKHIHVEVDR